MKWLIYLFSFLSINLVANQIAMKKLLAVTGEEIFSAEIWTVGGIYLNPFNYLTLYYKYHDAAPTVFQKFLPIAYIGFLLSFLALVGLKLLLTERTLTSEGTAHWATHRDLQKKNLLFPLFSVFVNSGEVLFWVFPKGRQENVPTPLPPEKAFAFCLKILPVFFDYFQSCLSFLSLQIFQQDFSQLFSGLKQTVICSIMVKTKQQHPDRQSQDHSRQTVKFISQKQKQ